jgi:hypothetical protein
MRITGSQSAAFMFKDGPMNKAFDTRLTSLAGAEVPACGDPSAKPRGPALAELESEMRCLHDMLAGINDGLSEFRQRVMGEAEGQVASAPTTNEPMPTSVTGVLAMLAEKLGAQAQRLDYQVSRLQALG